MLQTDECGAQRDDGHSAPDPASTGFGTVPATAGLSSESLPDRHVLEDEQHLSETKSGSHPDEQEQAPAQGGECGEGVRQVRDGATENGRGREGRWRVTPGGGEHRGTCQTGIFTA